MNQSKQPKVAMLGAGSMGSAIGRALTQGGARVLTSLEGRSSNSATRALEAGMEDASLDDLVTCEFILSIVPPSVAVDTARRLAPALERASTRPIYVDCNAINPDTVAQIERTLEATGTPLIDASIIGQPSSAKFYLSGPHAQRAMSLADHGLVVRLLDGPLGAASALKMSYAGITKGLTALGSAIALAAMRNGAGDALLSELAESQPALAAWLAGNVPRMPPKAYRWVGEMEEIAQFIGDDFAEHRIYEGAAGLYARLAGDKDATGALERFFGEQG
ncbi:NAD binding domain of 6-phosphogluconate dehydrogenase [Caballeronia fortuita]|uniref:NAD binding domain of 6-phosphogluconate dehydrogenase n=1 Tax=Caballeronia fortuita TaxID=1777138 RepID=A0A158BAV8_9BURK|nr:NAD(P)-dependent oxidoreductase [Caballeronia fortuita]SAK67205.1 NAD binding domain of 6-phosphogluconate dehydrogenase [Caballeronia fortuita]